MTDGSQVQVNAGRIHAGALLILSLAAPSRCGRIHWAPDAELAGEMHVFASPEALLARYRKAEAILSAARKRGLFRVQAEAVEPSVEEWWPQLIDRNVTEAAETKLPGHRRKQNLSATPGGGNGSRNRAAKAKGVGGTVVRNR